jgi:hypothetical protein
LPSRNTPGFGSCQLHMPPQSKQALLHADLESHVAKTRPKRLQPTVASPNARIELKMTGRLGLILFKIAFLHFGPFWGSTVSSIVIAGLFMGIAKFRCCPIGQMSAKWRKGGNNVPLGAPQACRLLSDGCLWGPGLAFVSENVVQNFRL